MGEYINPVEIANPRSPAEKLRASLFKNMPTNEMITRLKGLDPKASLSDVGDYIGQNLVVLKKHFQTQSIVMKGHCHP